jgi:hypothetical protein
MKEWSGDSGHISYSRCCVLDAPPEIPDGNYTVFFDRHRVSAIRQGGLWLPEDRAEPLPPEQFLDEQDDVPFEMEDALEILPPKNEAA